MRAFGRRVIRSDWQRRHVLPSFYWSRPACGSCGAFHFTTRVSLCFEKIRSFGLLLSLRSRRFLGRLATQQPKSGIVVLKHSVLRYRSSLGIIGGRHTASVSRCRAGCEHRFKPFCAGSGSAPSADDARNKDNATTSARRKTGSSNYHRAVSGNAFHQVRKLSTAAIAWASSSGGGGGIFGARIRHRRRGDARTGTTSKCLITLRDNEPSCCNRCTLRPDRRARAVQGAGDLRRRRSGRHPSDAR